MVLRFFEMVFKTAMNEINKAREFEKSFDHSKGLMPTPERWISYFWDTHKNKVVSSMLPVLKEAQSILFIGVGEEDILPKIQINAKSIIGLDLNRKFLLHSVDYCRPIVGDGAQLPVRDKTFNVVICNMVLHHIVGQGGLEKTISECSRVLKPGGKFFCFEPNLFHPSGIILTLLNKFHLYHRFAGGSNYEYALSPFKIAGFCRSHFTKVEIKAVTFSHPRYPPFIQNIFFSTDSFLARIYPLSFSFMIEGTR
jgi:ubiquinone/menaquinone biosynthesis C-methylase UbiE